MIVDAENNELHIGDWCEFLINPQSERFGQIYNFDNENYHNVWINYYRQYPIAYNSESLRKLSDEDAMWRILIYG